MGPCWAELSAIPHFILQQSDEEVIIILQTKVCIVKAMIFPVVMYRCEIWAIKKAES